MSAPLLRLQQNHDSNTIKRNPPDPERRLQMPRTLTLACLLSEHDNMLLILPKTERRFKRVYHSQVLDVHQDAVTEMGPVGRAGRLLLSATAGNIIQLLRCGQDGRRIKKGYGDEARQCHSAFVLSHLRSRLHHLSLDRVTPQSWNTIVWSGTVNKIAVCLLVTDEYLDDRMVFGDEIDLLHYLPYLPIPFHNPFLVGVMN